MNVGCGANPPLELRIPANGGTAHSISGTVDGDLPARLGDRFVVELKELPDFGVYGNPRNGKLDADHKFHLENVPAGRYRLDVYGVYGPEPQPNDRANFVTLSPRNLRQFEPLRHLIATQLITVSDQDISGLTLTQLTLPSVTGSVHFAHPPANWKEFKLSDLILNLVPHRKNGSLVAPLTDVTDNQGKFTIGAADAGEYEIQIQSADPRRIMGRGLYVLSAKLDGKDVNSRFLSLPAGGEAKLDVELGSDMAVVHAQVLPDGSFPMPVVPLNERCEGTGRYSVVLFPDPPVSPSIESEPEQAPHLFTAWSLGAGCNGVASGVHQYWDGKIQDIPPGDYYAIAGRDMNLLYFGIAFQGHSSAEQIKLLIALEAIAKHITLQPGQNLELELTDKTIEANRIAAGVGVADEGENLRPQNSQSCCTR